MDGLNNEENNGIEVRFRCKKTHQKYLINFILACSCIKLNELAELLGISMFLLEKVRDDFANLSDETTTTLVAIFLILFD